MSKDIVGTKEIAKMIADELILSEDFVSDLMSLIVERVTGLLNNGNRVRIRGLGTFDVIDPKKRVVVNPQKLNEMIKLPSIKRVKFKASHTLKRRIRRGK